MKVGKEIAANFKVHTSHPVWVVLPTGRKVDLRTGDVEGAKELARYYPHLISEKAPVKVSPKSKDKESISKSSNKDQNPKQDETN